MTRRVSSPALIGRDVELGEASADLDLATGGRMAMILVGGEAGIGKSRLAGAIAEMATDRGFRTVRGGCVPVAMATLPYAPFTQAFAALAPELEPDMLADIVDGDAPLVSRIAPALAGPSEVAAGSPLRGSRTRLIEAIAATLRRLAARAPVLLIVEDLHWADPESLDVLSYLTRSTDGTPMAILLSFRSDEITVHARLEPWLAELGRLVPVDRIELDRLSREETGRLIEAIRESRPTSRLVDAVYRRSNGNPFLVEELLQASPERARDDELAPILGEVLGDRLDAASARVWRVLGPLAVASGAVDDDLLASVAGVPDRDLEDALHDAIARGLIIVEHGGAHDRVRFRHELIREVAYDRLLAPARRTLHRAFAEALEARDGARTATPDHWAELARHWHAAGDADRALPAAIHAGEEAERTFAFGAALEHYERAMEDWGTVDAPAALAGCDRLDLLRRAANAAFLAGAGGTDLALRRQAAKEADRACDPERRAMARAELGHALWACGEAAESEAVFREAVALLPPDPPSLGRARALAVLGQVLMNTGRYQESLVRCEEALGIARLLGDRSIEGHASNSCGIDLGYLGRCGEAIESLERSRAIALEHQDADEVGRAYLNETEILTICGQRHRALELADEGIALCRRLGIHVSYGEGICLHGCTAAFELGDWARADRFAQEWTDDLDSPNDELYELAHTVELAVARGAWDEAEARIARMTGLITRYPVEVQYTGPWAVARAELAIWRAEPADALDAVSEGLTRLERTDDVLFRSRLLRLGLHAAADLAEVARARHDPALEAEASRQAAEIHQRVAPVIEASAWMQEGIALELAAATVEASAEESRLAGTSRPDLWRRAGDEWTLLERPYPAACARWREAEADLRLHHRDAAAAALGQAAAMATALGAGPLAREVAALGRRSRLGQPHSPASIDASAPGANGSRATTDTDWLTRRELEVLELLGRGLTDRQIGETLFISHYTASVHVSRILSKLGVRSRTEAAGNAYRLGLIAAAPRERAGTGK